MDCSRYLSFGRRRCGHNVSGWSNLEAGMATKKQTDAAKKNVRKAAKAARSQKSLASMSQGKKTALGKQGAAVAQRKRTGAGEPKTKQELYDEARRQDIPGRSRMGRSELAKALGHK